MSDNTLFSTADLSVLFAGRSPSAALGLMLPLLRLCVAPSRAVATASTHCKASIALATLTSKMDGQASASSFTDHGTPADSKYQEQEIQCMQ